MKTIRLNSAACDNAGRYVEAGTEIGVGNGKTQIAEDRARDIVTRKMADSVPAPRKASRPARATAKAAVAKPSPTPAATPAASADPTTPADGKP